MLHVATNCDSAFTWRRCTCMVVRTPPSTGPEVGNEGGETGQKRFAAGAGPHDSPFLSLSPVWLSPVMIVLPVMFPAIATERSPAAWTFGSFCSFASSFDVDRSQ